MPTYEYACRDCGEHLEVVQSFKDAALETCGRCGGRLRKVFSAAGIIFKGSGYYVTDSRKASGKGDGGGSKSGDAKPSETKTSETKTSDSKPSETKSSETKSSAAETA